MAAETDKDYVLMNVATGGQRYYLTGKNNGCAVDTIQLTPDQVAALPDVLPATPAGFELKTRNCSPAGILITVDRAEYRPVSDPPTGGGPALGMSVITPSANPGRSNLGLRFETVGGVTYGVVYEQTSRTPESGRHRYWFINGGEPVADTFVDLYFPLGTYLVCYQGDGTTPNFFGQGFTNKTQQFIYIGQPT